ncbi:MAG: FkbM family methyltransferase [Ignisphaera sp.]
MSFYVPGKKPLVIRTWDDSRFVIRPGTTDLGHATLVPELYELNNWFLPNARGVVIDVGANVGGYTVRACRSADLVIAIEPLPDLFELLRYNVSLNCMKNNVILIEKAVSDKKGYIELKVPRIHRYYASRYASIVRDSDLVYRVEADTLDNIITSLSIQKINLLKIDIEGAETVAFKGMRKTLEITDKLMIEIQAGNEWLIDELKKIGFTLIDKKEINYFPIKA